MKYTIIILLIQYFSLCQAEEKVKKNWKRLYKGIDGEREEGIFGAKQLKACSCREYPQMCNSKFVVNTISV